MIYTSQKQEPQLWVDDYGTYDHPFYVAVSNFEDQDFDPWWGNFLTREEAEEFIASQKENNYPNSRPRPLVNPILAAFRENVDLGPSNERAVMWLDWLDSHAKAGPEQVDHAEKVLTKIINVYG